MVAKIKGFVTRKQAGLRSPRSVSKNISPQRGGCAVHWGGPKQNIGSHNRCIQIWRSWQNYHMNTHGWVDIAYSGGFCNHGYALAGRGLFTRTAANGTNAGNQNYYAFTWVGGQGETLTRAAYDALDWWVQEARTNGNAGRRVRGHTVFTGTTCAGAQLNTYARKLDNSDVETEEDMALSDDDIDRIAARVRGVEIADGRSLATVLNQTHRTVHEQLTDPYASGTLRRETHTTWLVAGRLEVEHGPGLVNIGQALATGKVDTTQLASLLKEDLGDEVARALGERLLD